MALAQNFGQAPNLNRAPRQAGPRQRPASIDGYTPIGTYNVDIIEDEQGGTVLQYSSSSARQLNNSVMPWRQVHQVLGLARETFEALLALVVNSIIELEGVTDEQTGLTHVNFQPKQTAEGGEANINYRDLRHYALYIGGKYLVVSGLFEPAQTENTPEYLGGQLMLRLATKTKLSEIEQEILTDLKLKIGNVETPVKVIVDVQRAGVRTHIKPGLRLAKARPAGAPLAQVSAGPPLASIV
jgi:hypothetical protein